MGKELSPLGAEITPAMVEAALHAVWAAEAKGADGGLLRDDDGGFFVNEALIREILRAALETRPSSHS